jgi:hypothetical protein
VRFGSKVRGLQEVERSSDSASVIVSEFQASERRVAANLLTFLEDRGLLFYSHYFAEIQSMIVPIDLIRERLTAALEQVDRASHLAYVIQLMRGACREFRENVVRIGPRLLGNIYSEQPRIRTTWELLTLVGHWFDDPPKLGPL